MAVSEIEPGRTTKDAAIARHELISRDVGVKAEVRMGSRVAFNILQKDAKPPGEMPKQK